MRTSVAAVIAAALFFEGADGATISVTSNGIIEQMKVIRKEQRHRDEVKRDGGSEEPHMEVDMDEGTDDMCDLDFIPGTKSVSSCGKAHKDYQQIMEQEQCIQAAVLANATVVKPRFRISSEWYDMHPRGCFKEECDEAPNGVCYWFNPIGDEPKGGTKGIEGSPVCVRPKYLNGTAHARTGTKCANGYASVMNEDTCMKAGVCLGYCEGQEFRKGMFNASRYDEFPLGCFIHEEQGCVFFNPKPKGIKRLPLRPKGTPLCNVTSTTFFK